MKVRVTRKEVLSNYTNVIRIGYCDLQYMLTHRDANFYTAGIYGWNANIYEIDHATAIVTGYRSFGDIRPSYELVKAFNDKARAIYHDMDMSHYAKCYQLDNLIAEFVEEVVR